MNYYLRQRVLALGAGILVLGAWLWTTAIESEEELRAQEYQVPERFQQSQRSGPLVLDDEIDTTKILEPEPQHGWIVPPEPIRKSVGKVKKKIKRTVKKQ